MFDLPDIPYDLRNASPCRGGSLERLRSVTFITDGLSMNDRRLFLGECTRWIKEFNDWFCLMIGIHEGKGLHLLYDREIMVTGEALLDCAPEIELLGKTAREYGFAFSLSLEDGDLRERLDDILALADNKILTAIAVSVVDFEQNALIHQHDYSALEALVSRGLNVGVIGDINLIRQRGLFSSRKLSAADMTWYPLMPNGLSSKPKNPVRACYSRLRLYIDTHGNIYPCFGLTGLSNGVLGSIREPIDSTGLCEFPVLDLLDLWEREGPQIDIISQSVDDDDIGLPEICKQHRWSLS